MGLFSKQGLPVNSTGYQNYMKDAATRLQEEEYARQRAEYSKANRGTELGVEATTGQLGPNMGIPQQDGTGAFAYDLNPARKFQMEQNYERSMSGLPILDDRANTSKDALNQSINSGINTIEGKQWDKDNIPLKADTKLEQLHQYRSSLPEGDPRIAQVDAAILKESTHSKLIDVNVGGESMLTPGWMSDEVKDAEGIPNSQAIWIDAKGVPKVINKQSVAQEKAAVALDQMEGASNSLNKILNDYNPNSLAEIATSLIDMPAPVASEKKGWAEMVLRDATGAVINPSEYKDYDQIYMPQPGETPAEWERKAEKRHNKENAYRVRIGAEEVEYVSPYAKEDDSPKTVKWSDVE